MLNTDAYPRGETTGAEQSRWTLGYAGCCHGGGCSDVCVCVCGATAPPCGKWLP